jgi:small subunit ribosomal protein S20
VANSLSAKKRVRQDAKHRGLNRWRKQQMKDALRGFEEAVKDGDKAKAADLLKVAYKRLDKTAAKGTMHKNTANRRKSRLTKALNKLS